MINMKIKQTKQAYTSKYSRGRCVWVVDFHLIMLFILECSARIASRGPPFNFSRSVAYACCLCPAPSSNVVPSNLRATFGLVS